MALYDKRKANLENQTIDNAIVQCQQWAAAFLQFSITPIDSPVAESIRAELVRLTENSASLRSMLEPYMPDRLDLACTEFANRSCRSRYRQLLRDQSKSREIKHAYREWGTFLSFPANGGELPVFSKDRARQVA